jgi:hypothetical protein
MAMNVRPVAPDCRINLHGTARYSIVLTFASLLPNLDAPPDKEIRDMNRHRKAKLMMAAALGCCTLLARSPLLAQTQATAAQPSRQISMALSMGRKSGTV